MSVDFGRMFSDFMVKSSVVQKESTDFGTLFADFAAKSSDFSERSTDIRTLFADFAAKSSDFPGKATDFGTVFVDFAAKSSAFSGEPAMCRPDGPMHQITLNRGLYLCAPIACFAPMWLAGLCLGVTGVLRTLPRIEGRLSGPYEGPVSLDMRPQALYHLPEPGRHFGLLLRAHQRWCVLHRGQPSLATWQQVDLRPWAHYAALLRPGSNGTVRPMELPQLQGHLRLTFRLNAHLLPLLSAEQLRFYYKEAQARLVRNTENGFGHYRYVPEAIWYPSHGPLRDFEVRRTRRGRALLCTCVW